MIEIQRILEISAVAFGVDIKEKNRKKIYVLGRSCYYYYARKLTDTSLERIVSLIGDGDMNHSVVIHSLKNYEKYRKKYFEYNVHFKSMDKGIEREMNGLEPVDSGKIPKEFMFIIENYSKIEIDRFINGKVIPDIMMYKDQKKRIKSAGIRQN